MIRRKSCQTRLNRGQSVFSGLPDLFRRGRLRDLAWRKCDVEQRSGVTDQCELCRLINRYETVDGQHLGDQWHGRELLQLGTDFGDAGYHDVNGKGVRRRRCHEVIEGLHRLGSRVLGVKWVRIKTELRQQCEAGSAEQDKDCQQRTVVPPGRNIKRRRPAKADLARLAWWLKQPDGGG